jgi:hypothetical protein
MRSIDKSSEHLWDEHEVASITSRSVASVRRDRLLRRGCPYVKIGASVRYRRSDVEGWLASLQAYGSRSAEES